MLAIPAPMQAPEAHRQQFTGRDWLYEIKFDGYRCRAGVERSAGPPHTRLQLATDAMTRVQLLTKSGARCTTWFPEIAEALALLPGGPHVIDGEVCVLRARRDERLHPAASARRAPKTVPWRSSGNADGVRSGDARRGNPSCSRPSLTGRRCSSNL